ELGAGAKARLIESGFGDDGGARGGGGGGGSTLLSTTAELKFQRDQLGTAEVALQGESRRAAEDLASAVDARTAAQAASDAAVHDRSSSERITATSNALNAAGMAVSAAERASFAAAEKAIAIQDSLDRTRKDYETHARELADA